MTAEKYIDAINSGHLLYWDMLGGLRGATNHKEDNLRWLTGGIEYNYYCNTSSVENVVTRMNNNEIPKTLTFFTDSNETGPIESFKATGLFIEAVRAFGMAHDLEDAVLPEPDNRLKLFRVREAEQLKMAGSIFNAAFEYRIFSFENYIEMMGNEGQFFYMAEYDGLPVGACMSQYGDDYVNISWAGTLPGYRKLGIAGHLIQAAECDGFQNGKTIGVLYGFPEAIGAYRRIGYKEYCLAIILELIQ